MESAIAVTAGEDPAPATIVRAPDEVIFTCKALKGHV
jgi:hypothetical protein